jgi:hypothetical protein
MSDRKWLREIEPPRPVSNAAAPLPPAGIDASAIISGVLSPDRMGSGSSNSGGLVLHDDGVWRAPSGGGGGGGGNSYFPSGWS